jgi:hypothetical protein
MIRHTINLAKDFISFILRLKQLHMASATIEIIGKDGFPG